MAVCAFCRSVLSSPSTPGVAPLASLRRPACLESTSLLMSDMSLMSSVSAVSRVWEDFTAESCHLPPVVACWGGVAPTQALRLAVQVSLCDVMQTVLDGVPMGLRRIGPTPACPCMTACMAGESRGLRAQSRSQRGIASFTIA